PERRAVRRTAGAHARSHRKTLPAVTVPDVPATVRDREGFPISVAYETGVVAGDDHQARGGGAPATKVCARGAVVDPGRGARSGFTGGVAGCAQREAWPRGVR